jgi:hypothetical protein
MAAGPHTNEQRPAIWALALLMGSIVLAGASVFLLAWF